MHAPPLIRRATTDDAAQLAALCGELGYPATEDDVRERLVLLGDPERALLVAVEQESLIGFVDAHVQRVVEADAFGEVGGLVVAATRRRSGVGASLLAAAADWSRARGLSRLWIRVNVARREAQSFYAEIGCRQVKDQHVYEYPL